MEQPPLRILPTADSTALVSVDVANVGVLWTRDSEFTWGALNQLERLIETMVDDLGGRVQNHSGDSFIVAFDNPAAAVMWCARVQEGLLALDWPDALAGTPDEVGVQEMLFGGLMARMAIHSGTAEELEAIVGLAHSGQVLVSGSTFDRIDDPIPTDLRVESLGEVTTASGTLEVRQVTTRLLSRRRFPALAKRTSGLPAAPNCFVGRQADLADLRARLRTGARMVNITCVDGMGKTRLALHLARTLEPITPGGAALVQLNETRDTTDLMIATAWSLGISLGQDGTGTLAERIGHAIAGRNECILVFDGFGPHLDLDVLITWVRLAPHARFVVTSTEPLSSELSTHLNLEPLNASDAEAMYLARVHRRLRAGERPIHASQVIVPEDLPTNPSELEAVAGLTSPRWNRQPIAVLQLRHRVADPDQPAERRIQAALDAVPLLIQMGMPDQAAALLDSQADLFRESPIDWAAAKAFALVSAGRFRDAEAVLDGPSDDPAIELMRGRLAHAEARHHEAIEHVAPFVNSASHAYIHGLSLAALDEWEAAVLRLEEGARASSKPIERGWILASLGRVHQDLGRASEAERCLAEALAHGANDPHLVAQVHRHRFEGASAALQMDAARHHLEQSLAWLSRCGDRAATATALIDIAVLDLIQRHPENARERLDRALQICRTDGLGLLEARTLLTVGIAHRTAGDTASALDAFVEAAALAEADPALLGMIVSHQGAAEAAVDAIENAEAAFLAANEHLASSWDMLANTMQDMLRGFVDLARAREAALDEQSDAPEAHVDQAMNRLARGSSFETRSTPPRGREAPSRINEFRLARLMLDNAIAALGPSEVIQETN